MRLLLTVAMVAAALPALAADIELPALAQPGQWNYITADDAATSSRCVGRPVTALCAAETLLACFQRGRFDFCRMVDDGADQYATVFASPAPGGQYLAYRVVDAKRLTDGELPADEPTAGPGDVLLVIDQREGTLGRTAYATGAPPQRFLLRRQGDGSWKVVHWGGPGD